MTESLISPEALAIAEAYERELRAALNKVMAQTSVITKTATPADLARPVPLQAVLDLAERMGAEHAALRRRIEALEKSR